MPSNLKKTNNGCESDSHGLWPQDGRPSLTDDESTSKLKIVEVPSIVEPIQRSPGFAKKALSDYKLDILGLCGFGCKYCSSNVGNYLRINRARFAELTERQLGERLLPAENPELTFIWLDVIEKLVAQLDRKKKSFGEGQTLVFSMLTDG
ncbi:MAG: hypothetical protein KDA84_26270, partial [Planctomycetaceae bacterium]|nr:hypothetical protein [Planctomycetaceae bacterium]